LSRRWLGRTAGGMVEHCALVTFRHANRTRSTARRRVYVAFDPISRAAFVLSSPLKDPESSDRRSDTGERSLACYARSSATASDDIVSTVHTHSFDCCSFPRVAPSLTHGQTDTRFAVHTDAFEAAGTGGFGGTRYVSASTSGRRSCPGGIECAGPLRVTRAWRPFAYPRRSPVTVPTRPPVAPALSGVITSTAGRMPAGFARASTRRGAAGATARSSTPPCPAFDRELRTLCMCHRVAFIASPPFGAGSPRTRLFPRRGSWGMRQAPRVYDVRQDCGRLSLPDRPLCDNRNPDPIPSAPTRRLVSSQTAVRAPGVLSPA